MILEKMDRHDFADASPVRKSRVFVGAIHVFVGASPCSRMFALAQSRSSWERAPARECWIDPQPHSKAA